MAPKRRSTEKVSKNSILDSFLDITKKHESFLSIEPKNVENSRHLLKSIYDFGVASYYGQVNGDVLPKLEVENTDEEQIWQQIELRNNAIWDDLLDQSAKILSTSEGKLSIKANEEQIEDDAEEDIEVQDEQSSKTKSDKKKKKEKRVKFAEPEPDSKKSAKSSKKRQSIVDDDFFNLNEMNAFLDSEDKKEMNDKNVPSDNEEFVDYFERNESDDEFDAADAKFEDFFDNDDVPQKGGKTKMKKKQEESDDEEELSDEEDGADIRDELTGEEEEDDIEDEDLEDEEKDDNDGGMMSEEESQGDSDDEERNEEEKSTFEKREERLRNRIKEYEEDALTEKPWQLKGEVVATNRPQNSILEEILEFDAARPAPIITEETTMRLEDIIRRRIKDKAWDDVEKKVKLIQTDHEFKKQLILDQEKSKESLANIYEREYRNQIEKLNSNEETIQTESKEHQKIRNLMKSLFMQLDALSNFHYTPKPAVPEIKIITNTPALNMEEVAPVAVSDATFLAPEEVKTRIQGEVIGKTERTKTDKNRDRKKIKLKQKLKAKKQHEKELLKQQKGTLSKKGEKDLVMKSLMKNRNVKKMEMNDKAPKTSTTFFNQLQDKVSEKKKVKKNAVKKDRNSLSAKKLKL